MITHKGITCQLKFLEKMIEKKSLFLQNFFNKFARKPPCNMRIFGSVNSTLCKNLFFKIICLLVWVGPLLYTIK